MRYHFTLVRMAIIKKFTSNNARKGVEKREPSRTISADKLAAMESSMEVPQKTKAKVAI